MLLWPAPLPFTKRGVNGKANDFRISPREGYNVINTWPELRELGNLEHVQAGLVELLASYGAFRGAEPLREALRQFKPGQEI
jgi:hypothetical protein